MKPLFLLSLTALLFAAPKSNGQAPSQTQAYENAAYRFSVNVPGNWKLYGEIRDDSINHRAIVDWGIPVVHSELENADIENSISITAYKSDKIKGVGDLILSEYLRRDPTATAMEIDSTADNARIIYATREGLKYKGKSYFVFKDGIGYVINFMATPGTYDKNIAIFETFSKSVQYL